MLTIFSSVNTTIRQVWLFFDGKLSGMNSTLGCLWLGSILSPYKVNKMEAAVPLVVRVKNQPTGKGFY